MSAPPLRPAWFPKKPRLLPTRRCNIGEPDCLAVLSAGYPFCVSVPDGAPADKDCLGRKLAPVPEDDSGIVGCGPRMRFEEDGSARVPRWTSHCLSNSYLIGGVGGVKPTVMANFFY